MIIEIPQQVINTANSIQSNFGNDIKYIRYRSRLNQVGMAKVLGAQVSCISQWEKQERLAHSRHLVFLTIIEWANLLRENTTPKLAVGNEYFAKAKERAALIIADFPATVLHIRKSIGINQSQLGELLGVTNSTICG